MSGSRAAGRLSASLGRRTVLRAGAGAAAGVLLAEFGGARAAPARQGGGFIQGGRWSEAEGFALAQRADPAQYIGFTTEFPIYAVAPSWSGEGDPGATVELLWSADGVVWSEPVWIGLAGHRGPDRDGRNIGSLMGTPGSMFFQYRTYDAAGNLAALPGFEIDYMDATAGPTMEQVASPATTPVFAPPPVISRAGWGADEALRFGKGGKEIFPVEYEAVEHVIIHHADTANFNDPVLEMRSIYYFHAVTRGWGDIAYNYLVDFMGNVYEGRVGGETAVGTHAEGYNRGSCGICLMGRFFETGVTPEMHNAIVWITSWAGRDLDPEGAAPFHDIGSLPTICGHRDVNNTSCPGDEFYQTLGTVRTEVRRVVKGRDEPEPPPPQWYPGMQVITTEEGASLRSGPGLEFENIATVAFGEVLTVLDGPATNNRIIWYQVQGSSLTGWIAGRLLFPDPNAAPATAAPVEAPPPDPVATAPTVKEASVAETPPTEVPADGETRDDDGRGGGRNGDDRERRQEAWPVYAPGTTAMVIGGPLNLRSDPGLWGTVLTALPDGAMVTIDAGPSDGDGIAWYYVITPDGALGWCDGTYLQPV